MEFLRRFRILITLALFSGFLTAQTNRGGISGTVFDKSGAVVPGATVIITNVGTNETKRLTTSESGAYAATDLEPVTYRVEVDAPGFRKALVEKVKVDTATTTAVDVTLQTGNVTTEVKVTAKAPLINSESGTAGQTVTEREIQDVPLVNRSVLDLALTVPNVSGDAGSENPSLVSVTTCPGCNLSLNGGRPLNTLLMADGTNNTGISLARTMVSFTPETVQEFTVQTSAFSAEYGTSGGGVINASTKSGTNQLTGTALWYNRNPALAAAPWTLATTNRPPPTLRYNQFSLAAGGPVYIPKVYNGKNKTFWFGAIEPFYRRDFLAQDALLPTEAMRQGDWSNTVVTSSGTLPASVAQQFGLASTGDATIYNQFNLVGNQFVAAAPGAFPGNVIPQNMLDSTYLKSLQYYAAPGAYYIGSNGLIANLYDPRLLRQDERRYTLRIDDVVSSNHRLNFRYTGTPIVKRQATPSSPTSDSASYSYAKQGMLAYTWTISPTLMNDLRINVTRGNFSDTVAPQWDPQTGENLNTALGLPSILPGGLPSLPDVGGQGSTMNQDHETRYGISDILYKYGGNRTWKFGVDVSRSLQNVIPLFGAIGGVYSFNAIQTNSNGASNGTGGNLFASFELGVPNNLTIRNVTVPYYYRWNAVAGFLQNDWKVKPNLTLNLGLRYSLHLPRTEKYNHQGVFRPDLAKSFPLPQPLTLQDGQVITSALVPPFAYAGLGTNSEYLYPANYNGFEPRFGFAWSPDFSWNRERRLVIRGGYGLSHAPVSGANRLPSPDFSATTSAYSPTSGQRDTTYIMRLGENPPVVTPVPPDVAFGATSNGLLYMSPTNSSLNIGGFAVSPNFHTPYVQSFNFSISWQMKRSTVVEAVRGQ